MDSRAHLLRPVSIGTYTTRGNLFLAPVAGYSDAAFRSVVADLDCDFAFTEMVSAEALTRGSGKTLPLLARADNEREYAVQLFGADPERMADAARMVMRWAPSVIDINCGCPVPKIVKSGAGSALLRTPARIAEIVRAMRDAVPVPITVKIRLGWDARSINYIEVAAAAVRAGAAAVTLHARTREQGYAGTADWSAIAALKRAAAVPIFGSGDVFTADAALRMLAETGCDGVMLARGAVGDPFVFRRIKAMAAEGTAPDVPVADRVAAAERHFRLSVGFLGERTACVEFRKQFCAYTKGMPSGAPLRADAVKAATPAEWAAVFERWRALAG